MRRRSVALKCSVATAVVLLLIFCQQGFTASSEEGKASIEGLVSADNEFGFKLFDEILKNDFGKNIFISPVSVAIALQMTYNGAAGDTRQAMAEAMKVKGMSLDELNRANAALKSVLKSSDPKVQLSIANSLWAKKGLPFKQDFIRRNRDYYKAEVSALDFNKPEAASTINRWVSKNTNGKIEKIVEPPIDPLTILFLINAVYFKGKWTVEFDEEDTKKGFFYLLDGTRKTHPMMRRHGNYKYYRAEKFQAISLPYGNERFSMYVFLPNEDSSLKEFYGGLNAKSWNEWMSQFRRMEGDIALPRFKIEYEALLNEALSTLCMGIAFDGSYADFSNMVEKAVLEQGNVYISKVKHKTFIEVDEEGTEAAAATSVEMMITAVRPSFRMVVERPFFFAIVDDRTKAVLFMGSVVEPK